MFCSYRRFFRGDLKVAEGLGPHVIEVGAETGYALRIELVESARSGVDVEDETGVLEHLEVLGNGRPADGEGTRELVDGEGAGGEPLEDGHAGGVAQGIETGLEVSIRHW
jgi:hypothetical protein